MIVVVHKMHGCNLCTKCIKLLKHWGIKYRAVYDLALQDRPYPYITFEYEYTEIVDMIAKGNLE